MAPLWNFDVIKKYSTIRIRVVEFAHKYINQFYNYYILGLIDASVVSQTSIPGEQAS
jgi:hypothetical protein